MAALVLNTTEMIKYLDENPDKIKAPLHPLKYAAVDPSGLTDPFEARSERAPLHAAGVPMPAVLAIAAACSLATALITARITRRERALPGAVELA